MERSSSPGEKVRSTQSLTIAFEP